MIQFDARWIKAVYHVLGASLFCIGLVAELPLEHWPLWAGEYWKANNSNVNTIHFPFMPWTMKRSVCGGIRDPSSSSRWHAAIYTQQIGNPFCAFGRLAECILADRLPVAHIKSASPIPQPSAPVETRAHREPQHRRRCVIFASARRIWNTGYASVKYEYSMAGKTKRKIINLFSIFQ